MWLGAVYGILWGLRESRSPFLGAMSGVLIGWTVIEEGEGWFVIYTPETTFFKLLFSHAVP
jgi:hypothetical protein